MTIYLDNASTSYPKPDAVYNRMVEFLRQSGANPGRSGHKMAIEAEHEIDLVRLKVARLIRAKDPSHIVFTLNGTDALNIGLKGILRVGDHVVTSALEHNSVSRPLETMQTEGLIDFNRVGFDASGVISPDDIRKAIRSNTRLIVLTHASNVLGTIQPIDEVAKIAREHDLLFLVDAAQTAGTLDIDVEASMIDLLAAPGHKSLLGPPGTGFLYTGPRAASVIRPVRVGGTGGDSSSRLQPQEFPFRLEGGTPNTAGIAGLGAAIDFINERGMASIRHHELSLVNGLVDRLTTLPTAITYPNGRAKDKVAVATFNLKGLTAAETGTILDDSFDIAVRAGLHCAPFVHESLGTMPDGTVRVSFGPFSIIDDVDRLFDALVQIS